jgi:hypothetical protein
LLITSLYFDISVVFPWGRVVGGGVSKICSQELLGRVADTRQVRGQYAVVLQRCRDSEHQYQTLKRDYADLKQMLRVHVDLSSGGVRQW